MLSAHLIIKINKTLYPMIHEFLTTLNIQKDV